MPLEKIRSYFVKGERQQNVNSSLMPSSSNQLQQIGQNNAAISSTSSSPEIPKNFRSIFRIKRQQKAQFEGIVGTSDETLKISDSSNALRRHRRQSTLASIFTVFSIPCFLLCFLSFLFIILLFLVTGYHLAKYMHPSNDSMPIAEFRGDDELAAIAGWHFGGEEGRELYSANLFINLKENKNDGNEKLSGITFVNGTKIDILNGKSPLNLAVENGDLELVKYLIENGANVRAKDQNGWTPLHSGALNGQRTILLYLLKYWQENGDENELESILKEMEGRKMAGNEWEKIKLDLKEAMAKLNSKRNERLELPIIGHAELKMQEYIHLGQIKKNEKQRQIWGDLLKAAKHGKVDLMRKLLDQGADINETRNGFGNSALHLASTYGHLEVVKLLLEMGADVRARNTKQQTALYYSACEGKEQVVILLIEFGAEVNARGKDGNTPLHCAAEEGWERIEQILIENGAEVNAKNERGYIPLHWAAQYGKAKACSTLLANGADVNAKVTKNEVTALHLAAQEGHKHILELLLENGANLEEVDRYGWTALHYAIRNGRIGCVKFLLDKWNGHKNEGPSFFALIHGEDNQIKELMMHKLFHSKR